MITITDLVKSFGKIDVLKKVNLAIPTGKITAILGPNGSGKSTLIKSILGLVIPDSGDISWQGRSILRDNGFRSKIGYMPQIGHFPDHLRIYELFRFISDLRGISADPDRYIQLFQLEKDMKKPLSHLSGGTRQKVSAILAFMFDPEIIILDEPSVGLDPVSSIRLKELVLSEKANGKTLFFTSHVIPTVEEIADEITFILEGEILFQGTASEMKEGAREKTLEMSIAQILEKQKIYA